MNSEYDPNVSQIRSSSGGVIICGVPCSGKTTVLRDVARILSLHDRRRVSLVDTRGELASVYRGEPQLNVGLSDTLSAYPRAQGIIQAVRVFSPEFILCDEIGSPKDASAILNGLNSGVRFLVTAHAGDYTELKSKPFIRDVLAKYVPEAPRYPPHLRYGGKQNKGAAFVAAALDALNRHLHP